MGSLVFFIMVVGGIHTLQYLGERKRLHRAYTLQCRLPRVEKEDIVFKGSRSGIDTEHIHRILTKRFRYYRDLNEELQIKFLKRLRRFMASKTFIIKEGKGVKEMPVLAGAAAVQLTFGLPDYKLDFYRYIRIFPAPYFAEGTIKVLAGNVQENVITLAWDHLLSGYNNTEDGKNVALHEMSHALYIQKMVIEKDYATRFEKKYRKLITHCHEAHALEKKGVKDLYSDYADQNLQEFWAESCELFFERPDELETHYPQVFQALKFLLRQDPARVSDPVMPYKINLRERFSRRMNVLTKARFS